jgi:hypothetical protein
MEHSFQEADEIYGCCNAHSTAVHSVKHQLVWRFVTQLRCLERNTEEWAEEQYWSALLRPLRRYRYNIASMPLALNHPVNIPHDLIELVSYAARTCRKLYPARAEDVEKIAQIVDELRACRDAPLMDGTQYLLNTVRGTTNALVLRSSINIAIRKQVRALLKDYHLEVVTYSALLSLGVFENLIYIGPLGWFPESARSSPRGRLLTSVKFSWLADGQPLVPSFISTGDASLVFPKPQINASSEQNVRSEELMVSPGEAASPINWVEIGAEIARQSDPADTDEEQLGRLLMLNGSMALIVDATPGAKMPIIKSGASTRLHRIPVDDLEAGMYILVRTGGGGNLVAEVADTILKDRAKDVRRLQDSWKIRLTDQVKSRGENAVLRDLEDMGCKRATYYNLRNWMSSKTIRPQFDDDFLSVLILCELGNDDDLIANANLLDRVHRIAGFKIRRELLALVAHADLTRMVREGVMEFQLPGARGGSFTAYRIDEVAPKPRSVPIGLIGQTYNVELANG